MKDASVCQRSSAVRTMIPVGPACRPSRTWTVARPAASVVSTYCAKYGSVGDLAIAALGK